MRIMWNDTIIDSFYGEYKNGVFSKKNTVELHMYKKDMRGTAVRCYDNKFFECPVDMRYEDILLVEERNFYGCTGLYIEGKNKASIVRESTVELFFPNIERADVATDKIKGKVNAERAEQELYKKKQQEGIVKERRKQEERKQFFAECYEFHIGNEETPYFELQRDELLFACIYIAKDKSLNFLRIDGMAQEESNACIPFEKIHYYEKAGSIHYTSDITGNYSSFGGSITGGTISKKATILGGLLFGPMGMAAGAVLSHKPMNAEVPQNEFVIASEVRKIDDRNVIVNYFSDSKKQYIDIELPADIYNFLQTHYPEKKYGIVLEIEKNNAIKEQIKEIGSKTSETPLIGEDNEIDVFEKKIKKLKMMYENGILSDEEFEKEKKKILEVL